MIVRDIQTERKTNIVTLVDKLVIKTEINKTKQKLIKQNRKLYERDKEILIGNKKELLQIYFAKIS